MKTLVLATVSAAALLAAGGAFAQAAQAPATGPSVTSDTASDVSSVTQIGTGNAATVQQAGPGGSGTTANTAVVLQGADTAAGSDRSLAASSHDNTATVKQVNTGNQALVLQGNTLSTDYSNPGKSGSLGNTSNVSQTGTNGVAFSYQFGSNNNATINQSDNAKGQATTERFTFGVADRTGTGKTIDSAVAFRNMNVGDAQAAANSDFGASGRHAAVIAQDWATDNSADIEQAGTQNRAVVAQAFQKTSQAVVNQNTGSSNNNALIQQQAGTGAAGSNDYASVTQSGSTSVATVSQINAAMDHAEVVQAANSANNKAYTYQTASLQWSTIDQSGAGGGNKATVSQFGTGDTSAVTQVATSAGNTASVAQNYMGALSSVYQNGASNTATVAQYAGATTGGAAPAYATVRR